MRVTLGNSSAVLRCNTSNPSLTIDVNFEEEFTITHENLKFEIDFAQFFQYYKVLNSKFLAEKIGNR